MHYKLKYELRTTIKGQVLVDFIALPQESLSNVIYWKDGF